MLNVTSTLVRMHATMGPDCPAWVSDLLAESKRAQTQGLDGEAREWRLIARAADLVLAPGDDGVEFRPSWPSFGADRGPMFSREELGRLVERLEAGAPLAFQARVYDLKHAIGHDVEAAERGALAYLEDALHAVQGGDPERIVASASALLRAGALCRALPEESRPTVALKLCLAALRRISGTLRSPTLSTATLALAEQVGGEEEDQLAPEAIQAAELAAREGEFHWSRRLYAIAIGRQADAGAASTLRIIRASLFAEEARERRAAGDAPFVCASFFLAAIDEMRRESPELESGLRAELGRELEGLTGPAPRPSAELARLIHMVRVTLDVSPSASRLRIFAGLPLAASPGAALDGPGPLAVALSWFDGAVRASGTETGADVLEHARLWSESALEAARVVLARREGALRQSIRGICADSEVLAPDSVALFERGTMACFEGDPELCLSLLLPQLARMAAQVPGAGADDEALRSVLDRLVGGSDGDGLAGRLSRGLVLTTELDQGTANLAAWAALRVQLVGGATAHLRRGLFDGRA